MESRECEDGAEEEEDVGAGGGGGFEVNIDAG